MHIQPAALIQRITYELSIVSTAVEAIAEVIQAALRVLLFGLIAIRAAVVAAHVFLHNHG